jgi:hypothetical protein
MMRRLWLACALAVLLPTIGHAQSCAGDRPNDICEMAPAAGATRNAVERTEAPKLGGPRDKISEPIRVELPQVPWRLHSLSDCLASQAKLPRSVISEYGVQDGEELPHGRGKGDFPGPAGATRCR